MNTHHRVLVIDDSKVNRTMLSHLLSRSGYVVDEAVRATDGLELARRNQPDVVLLDIVMPDIDGYEACRLIRADPALTHSKIIMLSARNMTSERLRGYEAGADDYITKPFDADELLAKVGVYTRLRSLEEVEHVKDRVIEVLQHTTRTPLTNILSYAELLRGDVELDQQSRNDFADVIYANATRLQRLLEKSESLASMKSGRFAFEYELVDLGQIVHTEVHYARIEAEQRGIRISVDIADQAWCIGDREQLQFVLSTVLDNAVRFSPDGSEVGVSVERTEESWHVEVQDSGPGISPTLIPRVFDALSNIEAPLHNTGDGLSLCISREIASAHDGSIHAVNSSGAGATITLVLPALSAHASKPAAEQQRLTDRTQGKSPNDSNSSGRLTQLS